jgi:hypothetical protein
MKQQRTREHDPRVFLSCLQSVPIDFAKGKNFEDRAACFETVERC